MPFSFHAGIALVNSPPCAAPPISPWPSLYSNNVYACQLGACKVTRTYGGRQSTRPAELKYSVSKKRKKTVLVRRPCRCCNNGKKVRIHIGTDVTVRAHAYSLYTYQLAHTSTVCVCVCAMQTTVPTQKGKREARSLSHPPRARDLYVFAHLPREQQVETAGTCRSGTDLPQSAETALILIAPRS